MYVIHGTWIPDETEEFVQGGGLYLWVETDVSLARRARSGEALHPRHLTDTALVAFLSEKFGIRDSYAGTVVGALFRRFFLLPTCDGAPLPSFELRRYVDEEIPGSFELQPWQVCCYRVPDVIRTLNDIHFIALNAAEGFQLGADFLFWHQFSQVVRQVIAREQYIPAIKYREIEARTGKTKGKGSSELHPGWEILSHLYEAAVPRYLAAMPTLCAAGSVTPTTTVHAKEPLLRHFGECMLNSAVIGTPLTAKNDQQIEGTFLYRAMYPYRPDAQRRSSADGLAEYRAWVNWRERLIQAQTTARFSLGFQLEEAPADDIENWTLRFQVAAKGDPSHRLRLADYWARKPGERAVIARPFGQDFERHLLLDLGHAARIYPELWRGLETSTPSGFHLSMDEAFAFLKEHAWVLEDAGYSVSVPAWWTPEGRRRAKLRLRTAQRQAKGKTAAGNGHLSLDSIVTYRYELSIGDTVVSEEEWRQLVEAKTPLVRFRGQWMELDRDRMQQLLEFWQTHREVETELTIADLLKATADSDDDLEWDHDPALQSMLTRLQDKSAFAAIEDPPDLQGSLRDYQRRGVAWLGYLESLGLNPCLADDMGLGKTLEVIARLLDERRSGKTAGPTLVIAPTSVLGNWRKEIERFAPSLRTVVHQGNSRHRNERRFREECRKCDVVITSFALARLDEKLLRAVGWGRVVDEAQNIKNPEAAQTRAITRLPAPRRLALTGTPVENRLRDLWSIFNFLNPGYLGKEAQFRKGFELPILKENDQSRAAVLKRLVEPFILRRLKTDQRIIADLPEKIEQKVFCQLTPEQASLYAAVVKDVEDQLNEAEGIQRKGLILSTLLRLKQICNHPAQFLQDGSAFTSARSHKLERLGEMAEEAISSGDSLLVFTQFAEIGSALERYVEHTLHFNTYYLYGGTSAAQRERMIEAFQDPETEPSIFILSLRAGGVGLNLTRANHVFHFDRWWNPAVEDQATDRAFRIGQRKNVFVHKFVAMGTVEERIDQMIEDKKRLSGMIVGADESWLTELDNDTFKDLITLRREAVLE